MFWPKISLLKNTKSTNYSMATECFANLRKSFHGNSENFMALESVDREMQGNIVFNCPRESNIDIVNMDV